MRRYGTEQTAPPATLQSSSPGKRDSSFRDNHLFFIELMASLVINAVVFQRFLSRPPPFKTATDARIGPPRRRSLVGSANDNSSGLGRRWTVRSVTTTLFFIDLMASLVRKRVAKTSSSGLFPWASGPRRLMKIGWRIRRDAFCRDECAHSRVRSNRAHTCRQKMSARMRHPCNWTEIVFCTRRLFRARMGKPTCLPRVVRGPVDFLALGRLASRRAGGRVTTKTQRHQERLAFQVGGGRGGLAQGHDTT